MVVNNANNKKCKKFARSQWNAHIFVRNTKHNLLFVGETPQGTFNQIIT